MKRLLSLLLALCLAVGLCGCQFITREIIERDAAASEGTVLKSNIDELSDADGGALYEHGMELAELLQEMLSSPEYFELMGGSEQLSQVIDPLMGADLSEPESACMVTFSEDALPLLMDAAEMDMDQFSGKLQRFLERRMFQSVPSILNSQQGAETLAAASILTVSDAWAEESLEQGCCLILNYPDACPVMVSFWGGDGLIEGTATLLVGTVLEEDSIEEAAKLFRQLGISGMHIRKLDMNGSA